MAKMAKMKQTDWNKQGKELADTAVPYYKSNLTRMNDYLDDPQERMDSYLNKYWTNNSDQSDFLRNYNRAMGESTANNYNATSGGFSSANQRNYEDLQRYQNDLASRLNTQGISQAYNMANQDYNNMLSANNAYGNAYNLGKAYSDVDQYNYIRKQNNSLLNQAAQWYGQLGSALGASGNPILAAAGAGMQAYGNAGSIDSSAALGQLGNSQAARFGYNDTNWGDTFGKKLQTFAGETNKAGDLSHPTLAKWFGGNTASTPAGQALTNNVSSGYNTGNMANSWSGNSFGNLFTLGI